MDVIYHWLIPALWIGFWAYWFLAALRVKRARKKESRVARLIYLALALVAFTAIVWPRTRHVSFGWRLWPDGPVRFFIGVALLVGGLGFAVWARVHLGAYWSGRVELKEEHHLIRTGPYRLVRHPIYSGILLGFFGTGVAAGDARSVMVFLLLAVLFLVKSRREERLLSQEFGEEYARYRREVPAFVPRVRSAVAKASD